MRLTQPISLCTRCGVGVEDYEWITNFGYCDSCFEEKCPCNENRPSSCPLHRRPDVVLEFADGE